jgi:hypothetical protein
MRTTLASVLVAGLIALGARTAAAQIDVNLAFTPDTASPGQSVTFFSSVANLGADPVTANLELTIGIGAFNIGPIRANMPLAAGAERSVERAFTIPSFLPAGTLTLTLRGTAGSSTDTATASLTITSNVVSAPAEDQLRAFGNDILDGMGATPLTTEAKTFSVIKGLYR